MTDEEIIYASNEWMRRYIDDPETFEAEFNIIIRFKEEEFVDDHSYGRDCLAYMKRLLQERKEAKS